MRPATATLCTFALLLPVSIEVPAAIDSGGWGETRVTAMGSMGRLAVIDRGCEGQVLDAHPREFGEIAGEVRHRFENGVAVGVRGGDVTEKAESRFLITDYSTYPYRESLAVVRSEWTNRYVNPSIGYEGRGGGIGVGYIMSREYFPDATGKPTKIDPSFHVRVGSLDGKFFRIAYMENVPLYAGGGYLDLGVGFHPHRLWNTYVGLSAGGPYDGAGVKLDLDYRILPHVSLGGRARIGSSGGENQSGFGLGVSLVSRRPVNPGRRVIPGSREDPDAGFRIDRTPPRTDSLHRPRSGEP